MRTLAWPGVVACFSLCTALSAGAQTSMGALAVDERRGDQYGWAVDYETVPAARAAALRECGAGCSVVLTFGRCGAYAADQDADSTAVGWAESFDSAAGARQVALSECRARGGGSGCIVRAWGLQRACCGGGVGFRPRYAAADPAGSRRGRLRRGRCRRPVRPADAGGDSELAVVTGYASDRLLEHPGGRGASRRRRAPCGDLGGCGIHTVGEPTGGAAGVGRGVGRPVLAVDSEQHEPGGVRGVSRAVPERGVPGAGAGPAGSATWFNG